MDGHADLLMLVHHLRGAFQYPAQENQTFALVELHHGPLGYV
jgi:hypothetical protein